MPRKKGAQKTGGIKLGGVWSSRPTVAALARKALTRRRYRAISDIAIDIDASRSAVKSAIYRMLRDGKVTKSPAPACTVASGYGEIDVVGYKLVT